MAGGQVSGSNTSDSDLVGATDYRPSRVGRGVTKLGRHEEDDRNTKLSVLDYGNHDVGYS